MEEVDICIYNIIIFLLKKLVAILIIKKQYRKSHL